MQPSNASRALRCVPLLRCQPCSHMAGAGVQGKYSTSSFACAPCPTGHYNPTTQQASCRVRFSCLPRLEPWADLRLRCVALVSPARLARSLLRPAPPAARTAQRARSARTERSSPAKTRGSCWRAAERTAQPAAKANRACSRARSSTASRAATAPPTARIVSAWCNRCVCMLTVPCLLLFADAENPLCGEHRASLNVPPLSMHTYHLMVLRLLTRAERRPVPGRLRRVPERVRQVRRHGRGIRVPAGRRQLRLRARHVPPGARVLGTHQEYAHSACWVCLLRQANRTSRLRVLRQFSRRSRKRAC